MWKAIRREEADAALLLGGLPWSNGDEKEARGEEDEGTPRESRAEAEIRSPRSHAAPRASIRREPMPFGGGERPRD